MKRRAACRRGAEGKKRCAQGRNIYSTRLFYYTRNQKSTLFIKKFPPRFLRFPNGTLPLQKRTLLTVEWADYRADTPYSAAARVICVAVCAICVAVIKMSAGAAAGGAHTQKRRRIKMRRRKKFRLKNMPENKLYYFFTARLHFTLHRALLRAPPLQTGKPAAETDGNPIRFAAKLCSRAPAFKVGWRELQGLQQRRYCARLRFREL